MATKGFNLYLLFWGAYSALIHIISKRQHFLNFDKNLFMID